jgi:hypothetical protein
VIIAIDQDTPLCRALVKRRDGLEKHLEVLWEKSEEADNDRKSRPGRVRDTLANGAFERFTNVLREYERTCDVLMGAKPNALDNREAQEIAWANKPETTARLQR